MNMRKSHQQHTGELYVQQMREAPQEMPRYLTQMVDDSMPTQHSQFFSQLPYFPIGVLDNEGRPWATLLCSPNVTILSNKELLISSQIAIDDHISTILSSGTSGSKYLNKLNSRYFSGVGVDFSNRRRNKLSGWIKNSTFSSDNNILTVSLVTDDNMGNCPKYITIRKLIPICRQSEPGIEMKLLNNYAHNLLLKSSTAFLATRHIASVDFNDDSDMGFNHRGGSPGFIRYYESDKSGHLVLPDYSGNQFYQSLGNVQSDSTAGLVILDFESGDALHVTGQAINIYNTEADAIMPSMTLITVITIDSAVLIKKSIQFELVGKEQFSPYNPPVKLLAVEMKNKVINQSFDNKSSISASLINIYRNCTNISTFTFRLSEQIDVTPGSYAIFDLSSVLVKQYQHMNQMWPQSINDDRIRTWTITKFDDSRMELSVTIKKTINGFISSFLHSLPLQKPYIINSKPFNIKLKGIGNGFTCFNDDGSVPEEMVWFAAGIGITPFLSFYDKLLKSNNINYNKITLIYSCGGDEINVINEIIQNNKINVIIYNSAYLTQEMTSSLKSLTSIVPRRLKENDIFNINNIKNSHVYLCGPNNYMADLKKWLQNQDVQSSNIHFESFSF